MRGGEFRKSSLFLIEEENFVFLLPSREIFFSLEGKQLYQSRRMKRDVWSIVYRWDGGRGWGEKEGGTGRVDQKSRHLLGLLFFGVVTHRAIITTAFSPLLLLFVCSDPPPLLHKYKSGPVGHFPTQTFAQCSR
jgi:hypothetical protein